MTDAEWRSTLTELLTLIRHAVEDARRQRMATLPPKGYNRYTAARRRYTNAKAATATRP